MGDTFAGNPKICGHRFPPALNDRISEPDLAVELECPRLNRQRARRCPWLGRLVDDPHPYAQPRQPKGQYEARWSSADDKDVCIASFTHRG
jgi:hypothetical protein